MQVKMKSNEIIDPTLCNRYPNEDQEYIFAFCGRPFGCLLSPHLPTPTATLIDYNLVKDLGMKMYDLQYQKFSFCGNKFRILGRVAISVQTIHDGFASGSFSIKANVVLDLNKNIDCECVAGVKLTSKLLRNADSTITSTPTSSRSSSPSPSAQSPSSPSPQARPSAHRSPPLPNLTSPSPPSPPGFPVQPQYRQALFKTQKRPELSVSLVSLPDPNPSILTANHYALSNAFNDADLQPTSNQELRSLLEINPQGRVEPGSKNATIFKTSQGFVYEFGHGRNRCVPDKCMLKTQEEMANNCGFHNQFYRPYNFQVCGPSCSGALCPCLQFY